MIWKLPESLKAKVESAWEEQFTKLFTLLGMQDTREFVDEFIDPFVVQPNLEDYFSEEVPAEDTSDLAD